jgi:hypothetical protein
MRPGQQNNSSNNNNKNRSRGRSNNNNNNNGGRKHVNPLSRNFESNGPDVKVRGNAAHIAEKYVQLARDAHASGDSVMAENYFQHAEHYFRIVSAAQPQGMQRTDQFGQEIEGDDDENDDGGSNGGDGIEQHARLPEEQQFRQQGDRQQNDRQQGDRQQGQQGDRQQNDRQYDRPQRDDRPMRDDRPQRDDRQSRFEQPNGDVQNGNVQSSNAPLIEAEMTPQGETENAAEPMMEGEPRRVRERRPRRRRIAGGEGVAAIDPDGPQPEVGELPAFITAGGPITGTE